MKPEFVPDFSEMNKIYFPDGEVINDLAIAKRIDGDVVRQHIEFNGQQRIVPMRQFDDDSKTVLSYVPRDVQTPVQMRQYLDRLKDIRAFERQKMEDAAINKQLRKFLS